MDSGALRVDERGDLYSSIPLGPHANQRILDAAQGWQPPEQSEEDWQGQGPTQDQPDMSQGEWKQNMERYMQEAGSMTPTTLGPQSGEE